MLAEVGEGETEAVGALFTAVYDELKVVARRQLKQSSNTLDTTGLVHELYLKVCGARSPAYNSRQHFYAIAARAMRCLLVDAVRRRAAGKRGGKLWLRVTFDEGVLSELSESDSVLRLDEALDQLSALDPSLVELVEMRYFAALSVDDIAQIRGVSLRTVYRDWATARAFLFDAIESSG
jgi:RNA polymerase sigma factor (TIGR02999 family)